MGKHIKTDFLCDLVQEDEMEKFMSEDVKNAISSFGLLLCEAISLFYRKDANKLFAYDVDEWAMVGCVYRYMWCLMQSSRAMKSFDIDVEYNRMAHPQQQGDDASKSKGKRLDKIKAITRNAVEKWQESEETMSERYVCAILRRMEEKTYDNSSLNLRPDIIVHRRGQNRTSSDNKLWVEFKKNGAKKEDAFFDQAKVMFNTSYMEKDFHYQLGAIVMLRKEFAHVGFFTKGKILHGVVVDSGRCRAMSDTEVEQRLWCEPKLDSKIWKPNSAGTQAS